MRAARRGSHRDYARWRARQIAYGQWRPWAEADAVQAHVRLLTQAGASGRAIARAAGVSAMTVHRIQRARQPADCAAGLHVGAALAGRLLAVTPAVLENTALRRDATGSRRRLRALVAAGYPGASLARYLVVPPATAWNLIRGKTVTVSAGLELSVRALYDRIWDQQPPERTAAERRAVAAARTRAARQGWPPPMGLDDDRIDDPAYRPRRRRVPGSGTQVMHRHAGRTARPVPRQRASGHRPGSDARRRAATPAADGACDEQ